MMAHGVAPLLVTAAVGYWVLSHAEKEKNTVKTIGKVLGLAIIIVSVLGATCKIYYQVRMCSAGKMGMMGKMACPAGHPGCTMNCPSKDK